MKKQAAENLSSEKTGGNDGDRSSGKSAVSVQKTRDDQDSGSVKPKSSKEFFKKMQDVTRDAIIEQPKENVELAGELGHKAVDKANAARDQASQLLNRIQNEAARQQDAVNDRLSDTVQRTGQQSATMREKLLSQIADSRQSGQQQAEKVIDDTRRGAGDAQTQITDRLIDTIKQAEEVANDIQQKHNDVSTQIIKNIGGVESDKETPEGESSRSGGVTEQIEFVLSESIKQQQEDRQFVEEKLEEGQQAIEDFVAEQTTVWEGVVKNTEDLLNKPIFDDESSFDPRVEEFDGSVEGIEDDVNDAIESTEEFVEELVGQAEEQVNEMEEDVQEGFEIVQGIIADQVDLIGEVTGSSDNETNTNTNNDNGSDDSDSDDDSDDDDDNPVQGLIDFFNGLLG